MLKKDYGKSFSLNLGAEPLTFNINLYVHLVSTSAPEESQPAQSEQRPKSNSNIFRHMTQKCIDENRVDTVNAEITAACKGTAEMLWRTLWNNENLGYLVIASINATTLYKDIEEHYGKLPYKVRQFRAARNNR